MVEPVVINPGVFDHGAVEEQAHSSSSGDVHAGPGVCFAASRGEMGTMMMSHDEP